MKLLRAIGRWLRNVGHDVITEGDSPSAAARRLRDQDPRQNAP
jgi:hypothetical protein